jgi:hypothetical protein
LIVQDLQTVRVFDCEGLKLVRTISPSPGKDPIAPLFVTRASNKDIVMCAFGKQEQFNLRCHTTPAEIEIIDLGSGERLAGWTSEDIPQSISPDGDLIAVSSSQAQRGVLPLKVLDTHGHKVAEMTGGFSFKDASPSSPVGRVIGLFVGHRELLLSPDEHFDQSGHSSGDSLQLVRLTENQVEVEQSIKPPHYRSTGEMATAANHKVVVALSWYVPDRALAHEGPMPNLLPEMHIFGRGNRFHMEAALPIHADGLRMSGRMENRRPRISADGSIIAIAQDTGVMVLRKEPGAGDPAAAQPKREGSGRGQ